MIGFPGRWPYLDGEPCERGSHLERSQRRGRCESSGFIWSVDLAAQSAHMNIDKVRFRYEFIMPYLFQEGRPRMQLVALFHHVFEQPELSRPQIDLTVVTLRSSIEEIELQRSHSQHRFLGPGWHLNQRFYRERLV